MPQQSKAQVLLSRAAIELARVAARKPYLAERAERAVQILHTHVAEHDGEYASTKIRPRSRRGHVVAYMFQGSSGEVYRVRAGGKWRCSCPDAVARDYTCKHSLAAWALWKSAKPPDQEISRAITHINGKRGAA